MYVVTTRWRYSLSSVAVWLNKAWNSNLCVCSQLMTILSHGVVPASGILLPIAYRSDWWIWLWYMSHVCGLIDSFFGQLCDGVTVTCWRSLIDLITTRKKTWLGSPRKKTWYDGNSQHCACGFIKPSLRNLKLDLMYIVHVLKCLGRRLWETSAQCISMGEANYGELYKLSIICAHLCQDKMDYQIFMNQEKMG